MSSISNNPSQMIHSMAFNTGPVRRVIQVESNNVEEKTCPICLEKFQSRRMITTACNHAYCVCCYLNLLNRLPENTRAMACSYCRQVKPVEIELFLRAKNLQLRHIKMCERSERVKMIAILHDGRNLRYLKACEQSVTLCVISMLHNKSNIDSIIEIDTYMVLRSMFFTGKSKYIAHIRHVVTGEIVSSLLIQSTTSEIECKKMLDGLRSIYY